MKSIDQLGKVQESPQMYSQSLSLQEEIDQLVQNFKNRSFSLEETTTVAHVLVEDLLNLGKNDLCAIREGLCTLLKLDIKELQREIISHLKGLFRLSNLENLNYDFKNNQAQELVNLEKQLSEIIELHLFPDVPSNLIISFLELHQEILERLWLLAYLIEDRSAYATIIEKNMPSIINCTSRWLISLEKRGKNEEAVGKLLEDIHKSLKRIGMPLSAPAKNTLNELKGCFYR